MIIYPAIDLRDGKCVRLRQGDYNQETIFGENPAEMAQRWVREGAQALHLVDLDGAKVGKPTNKEAIQAIVKAVSVPCQLGGGLRTEADILEVFSWGVERVILGTRALQDPMWLRELAQKYPQKIILGLDAREGKIATHGWLQTSQSMVLDVAQEFAHWPLAGIIYTDISRDGMMAGPNIKGLAELARAVPLPVIASGGVTTLEDISELLHCGLAGCIIGRSLYEGRISLPAALGLVASAANNATKTTSER